MEIKKELKLIRMNEVEATEIDWLWYPYIPYGKITAIQGDPGDGKTTAVLAIAAAATTGAALPESKTATGPMSVIFRIAEDHHSHVYTYGILFASAYSAAVLPSITIRVMLGHSAKASASILVTLAGMTRLVSSVHFLNAR